MGIPSFYKHLLQTVENLTSKTRDSKPQLLALDLNCAIYHCVRLQQTATPYTELTAAKWERDLVARVLAYIRQLDRHVDAETLYIAVDGVAPLAKLKQQRMRRFKSAKTAEEEARIKAEAQGRRYVRIPRWDTNAITPGTAFMELLTVALHDLTRSSRIVVSPADEPGEGEQKLMDYIRKTKIEDAVVYGLDADLIVLALFQYARYGTRVDLFREETEFGGGVKTNSVGAEQFLYMDMSKLAGALYAAHGRHGEQTKAEFLCDFVGVMNLLGNDFIPHGMALKIKDNGIERLLEYLLELKEPLVLTKDTVQYNVPVLKQLVQRLADTEPTDVLKSVSKKLTQRIGVMGGDAVERALARAQDAPLEWREDEVLVNRVQHGDRPQYALKPDWPAIYDRKALGGVDKAKATEVFCESLGWTLAYYAGEQVDREWMYPWLLPPRWQSILECLQTMAQLHVPRTRRLELKPLEQLALVLPESSFQLLPSEYKKLITVHPYAWPTEYSVASFGKRFLWECEPQIPLLRPDQIRNWIEELYD